jgi:predicted TIM-barrel fold metal-dependent hydrolase
MPNISRRGCLAALAASATAANRPAGVLVESHIHLFASDQKRFPYHRNAVYRPPAYPLADYVRFARDAKIDNCVIVHPEPYQDDHRYLEHCFANEPSPDFFKGTCLFDPIAADTPARMKALVNRNRGRIVALRIHANRERATPPTTSGAIRDRDLRHPAMKTTWRAATDLGLGIQMHFIPWHAEQIFELASQFRDTTVILDHLARAGQGKPEEFPMVLKLAKLPRVYMKFSGVRYSSKQGFPYTDAKPLVRSAYDAFGPDRMIWGGLGHNPKEFDEATEVFEAMFDYAAERDRAKIRGLNAKALFKFA